MNGAVGSRGGSVTPEEANKDVVRRYVDAFNRGDLAAMELFEIVDGRIRRRWGARDSASQARQLGIPLE